MKRVSLAGLAFQLWIHRQLTALGIECVVVNPADIPKSQKDKLQKTDANDSRNIGYRLMKHSSGEDTNVGNLTVRKHKQLRSDLVESAWTANLTFFEYFFDKKIIFV